MTELLKKACNTNDNYIFGYKVAYPQQYGVCEFNADNLLVKVVEKPLRPKSNYAVPGIYFFDNTSFDKAKNCKRSKRGEIEITSVINQYIEAGDMKFCPFPESAMWFDCGTPDDLLDASNFIKCVQRRTNETIGYSIS